MASSRKEIETSAIVRTRCIEMLQVSLDRGGLDWPLPPPPLQDSDLPPIEPDSVDEVKERALGLFTVDKAGFERHLSNARESIIPHRLGLTVDPEKEGERWLLRRLEDVARIILFDVCEGWLAASLDADAPDSERWYIGITLFNGLCKVPDPIAVNRGYHILESIALTHPPGRWPTRPEAGPHQMDWSPDREVKMVVRAEGGGIDAAHWLLDQMEMGDVERRILLIHWLRAMLERPSLIEGMALGKRFELMAQAQPPEVAAEMVGCLPRLFETDPESGDTVLASIRTRSEGVVTRALSVEVPALLRVAPDRGILLIDHLLSSNDASTRTSATSSLKELGGSMPEIFLERVVKQARDSDLKVRRMVVQACLRPYLELEPADSLGVFVPLWLEGDEVVGSRMRELLLRMQEVNVEAFDSVSRRILAADEAGLESFWRLMAVRDEGRAAAWKSHLSGEGERPEPLI